MRCNGSARRYGQLAPTIWMDPELEPPARRRLLRTAMLLAWRAGLPAPRPVELSWTHLAQRLIHGERVSGFTEADVRLVMDGTPPRQG